MFAEPRRAAASLAAALIATLPVVTTGPDVWAETFAEYFDLIKGFADVQLRGWGGYFTAVPQVTAAVQGRFLDGLVPPQWTARAISSFILFASSYLCLLYIAKSQLEPRIRAGIFAFVALVLASLVLHPSVNSMITVGYFPALPLLTLIALHARSLPLEHVGVPAKLLFVVSLLTKPGILFVPAVLALSRQWVFRAVCLLIGLVQAMIVVGPSPAGTSLEKLRTVALASSQALGATVDNSFLWYSLSELTSGLAVLGVLVGLLAAHAAWRMRNPWGALVSVLLLIAPVLPYGNLAAQFRGTEWHPVVFGSNIVNSPFKLQYRIISSVIIPLVLVVIVIGAKQRGAAFLLLIALLPSGVLGLAKSVELSQSASVNARVALFDERSDGLAAPCFAVTPLPGWLADELRADSAANIPPVEHSTWKRGRCQHAAVFNRFGDVGFTNDGSNEPRALPPKATYTYLIIVDLGREGVRAPALSTAGRCRVFHESKLVEPGNVNRYMYVAGRVGDGLTDPNSLRSTLAACLSGAVDQQRVNALIFYPDKNNEGEIEAHAAGEARAAPGT